MRQSNPTETQIVSILKEADAGRPVNKLRREHGINSATYYKWRAKYGRLEASHLIRLKELATRTAASNGCIGSVPGKRRAERLNYNKALRHAERR